MLGGGFLHLPPAGEAQVWREPILQLWELTREPLQLRRDLARETRTLVPARQGVHRFVKRVQLQSPSVDLTEVVGDVVSEEEAGFADCCSVLEEGIEIDVGPLQHAAQKTAGAGEHLETLLEEIELELRSVGPELPKLNPKDEGGD